MARIRIYLGKKQYTGYYDDAPLEVCAKKMKIQISTWSTDPLNIPVQESMDALKGATIQILEHDLEEDHEADPPKPMLPTDIKVGYYQLGAAPDKLSSFCRKNGYPFVEATWPD
ncbi:MAG: hypothetical protein CMH81_05110 [Nitrospiraceae bacterium]|nr:hypothetical protein [Nitrospiraceae bacterium]